MSSLHLVSLRQRYLDGGLTPSALVEAIEQRLAVRGDDAVWITRVPAAGLREAAARLEARAARHGIERLPLYGVPFAVKDNIDVAGLPTTAACPAFAYAPERTASAIARLIEAGALLVGKTNLDQFATGLVGTRSPYGVPRNPFDPAYIPGGSSSGSAVAVSVGLVSFAIGTDTAGSGRVPASFNNIVGLKPTRGLVSNAGVVPACRSLDCLAVFALTVADATAVAEAMRGIDAADPFSREAPPGFTALPAALPGSFRFGVPHAEDLRFFGNADAERLYHEAVVRMEMLGGSAVRFDYAPFAAAADLLYGSAWVAERTAAVGQFLEDSPDALHPVTRRIIGGGTGFSAVDVFRAHYRLEALRAETRSVWAAIDFLLLPTTGTIYRLDEIAAEPVLLNSNLAYYTNFANLLDLSAIAVPSGFQGNGLPAGVTLMAPAWHDPLIGGVAAAFHRATGLTLGATGAAQPVPAPGVTGAAPYVALAVMGAHLSGEPLNAELVGLGARFRRRCATSPIYRLYALPDGRRPGLVRDPDERGYAIEVEVWDLPASAVGAFVQGIAPPLGIGTVVLADGSEVKGFLCEAHAARGARDISEFGGWRGYRRSLAGS